MSKWTMMAAAALAAGWAVAKDGVMTSAPIWDLANDAGERSAQLARDGFLPLDAAHRFELPHTAVRDSQAFTVEMKIRCEDASEQRTISLLSQKTPAATAAGSARSPVGNMPSSPRRARA